jgi:hypothetical protein
MDAPRQIQEMTASKMVGYTGEVDGVRARLEIYDSGKIEYARPIGEPHPFVAVPYRYGSLDGLADLRRYRAAPGLEGLIKATLKVAREQYGPDWIKE